MSVQLSLHGIWRVPVRTILACVVAGLLIVVAVLVGGGEVDRHLAAVEAWIRQLGPWGMLVFACVFVMGTSAFVPDSLLCVVAGVLYGAGWGFVLVLAASLPAGALQFLLARRLLHERIERMLAARPSLGAIRRAVQRQEFRLQVLLRLTPLNPALVSYLLGASGVRFPGFLVASLAQAPILALEVYLGHAGRHAAAWVGSSQPAGAHEMATFAGLGVCVIVVVFISRMSRRAVMQSAAEASLAGAD